MNNASRQQQEMQPTSIRGLSTTYSERILNAVGMKRKTKTLYFTSSTSTTMQITNGGSVAYTGLYKCSLNENHGNDQEQCSEATKVANGYNRDGFPHVTLPLHNLQFHDSNNETKQRRKKDNMQNISDTNRPSYLYANTYIDNRKEHSNASVGSWEILRSNVDGDDGPFQFESVFRTLKAFDWNECDFKCCPYNSNMDDDPFAYSKDDENNYFSHMHSYVRTIPRSFSVDETTGDIFISWEGFYQNCNPANFVEEKKLQWTIGVSRLRTEDPYCVTDQVNTMANNFPRCTEPVSILHQSSTGRDVVLPYGGFTVIPAIDIDHRRSFLLSVLTSPEKGGELKNMVWTAPEGGNRDRENLSLNGDGTPLDHVYLNQWDGGTFRLHYNSQTGRPDYLCRSIFDKGIGCMAISANAPEGDQGLVDILPRGEEVIVLTEEQVKSFCSLKYEDPNFSKKKLVTGLEIEWKENEEDGTGFPQRVIFGCFEGENTNGKFGMIDLDRPEIPVQVLEGANPSSVVFLPQELEQSSTPGMATPSTIFQRYNISSPQSCGMVISFLLLCILAAVFHSKRRKSVRFQPPKSQSSRSTEEKPPVSESIQINTPYMELPTVDLVSKSNEPSSPPGDHSMA